jgi:hypothetical protein
MADTDGTNGIFGSFPLFGNPVDTSSPNNSTSASITGSTTVPSDGILSQVTTSSTQLYMGGLTLGTKTPGSYSAEYGCVWGRRNSLRHCWPMSGPPGLYTAASYGKPRVGPGTNELEGQLGAVEGV